MASGYFPVDDRREAAKLKSIANALDSFLSQYDRSDFYNNSDPADTVSDVAWYTHMRDTVELLQWAANRFPETEHDLGFAE